MPSMRIILDGDGSLPEMAGREVIKVQAFTVTSLDGGMQSARPSVAFIIPLPDGRFVFAETTLQLFLTAANAFCARHGVAP